MSSTYDEKRTMGGFRLRTRPPRGLLRLLLKALGAASVLFLIQLLFLGGMPPSPHGGADGLSKALVVASTSRTEGRAAAWLPQVGRDWEVFYYVVDDPVSAGLTVPGTSGNEAMVYMTFIIDHYHHLPDVVLFHHDHARAWHQEFDSLAEVRTLRAQYVAERGFASTRCLRACENVQPVGGPDEVRPLRDLGRRVSGSSGGGNMPRSAQLASLLHAFLEPNADGVVELPDRIAAPCCAQFAASRAAIRGRSLRWWIGLRQWLKETPLDSYHSGRLIEWTWHIWLGAEPYQ
ncbi:hypothetical protein GGR56DRAFT_675697 [Xylariaceae sp. FL0804]|nr:hypothetical protein GGR56DRAFT_675697 [Xylariaceae sp. FL0804]